MKTIHKFELLLQEKNTVKMPAGGQILSVQSQRDGIKIWALVNTSAPMETRLFEIIGTGQSIQDLTSMLKRIYIGTAQMGPMVWHVFEIV